MKYSFLKRARIISVLFIIISLVLVGRLFSVQVLNKELYVEAAEQQYIRPASGVFERGSILFETKNKKVISGATQVVNFSIEINTGQLKNKEEVYKQISSVIALDKEDFMKKASKLNDPSEIVAKNLNKEEADKILALKLAGVKLVREKERFYPGNNLASHTIGFVGFNQNMLEGRYGLERSYENILARDIDNPYVNFFAEIFTNLKKTILSEDDKEGDIVTTIEPQVQAFLEKELQNLREKYNVDSVGGIIINPQNGEIYAIAQKPDFDLNNFKEEKDISLFTNQFVENVFEFGSVVKPLVMASGIDAGVITAKSTYTDTGSVQIEKKVISNFDKKGRGANVNMEKVLGESLNTGMVLIYQKLGKEKFREYMKSFAFNEKTGIDLPNETTGLLSNLNSPRELEYANASFGQGIAMTPIGLVRALSSLANDGVMPIPHLVKQINYKNNQTEVLEYETKQTKLNQASTEEITRILVNVMDNYLRQGHAKLDNYSIAVKTGTAQIANPNGGGYYTDRNMHSFFGYFPAYDAKFLVFLFANNPKGSPYASQTWTDSFLKITNFLINYYEVPPDR